MKKCPTGSRWSWRSSERFFDTGAAGGTVRACRGPCGGWRPPPAPPPPPHTCCSNLAVLRALGKGWLPLLLNALLASPPGQRGAVAKAVSAYACAAEPALVTQLFKTAISKLLKVGPARATAGALPGTGWRQNSCGPGCGASVRRAHVPRALLASPHQVTEQARTGELGAAAVFEGGDTDAERRASFLEAALALAGGLEGGALATLQKTAVLALQVRGAWLHVLQPAGGAARRCAPRPVWMRRFAGGPRRTHARTLAPTGARGVSPKAQLQNASLPPGASPRLYAPALSGALVLLRAGHDLRTQSTRAALGRLDSKQPARLAGAGRHACGGRAYVAVRCQILSTAVPQGCCAAAGGSRGAAARGERGCSHHQPGEYRVGQNSPLFQPAEQPFVPACRTARCSSLPPPLHGHGTHLRSSLAWWARSFCASRSAASRPAPPRSSCWCR